MRLSPAISSSQLVRPPSLHFLALSHLPASLCPGSGCSALHSSSSAPFRQYFPTMLENSMWAPSNRALCPLIPAAGPQPHTLTGPRRVLPARAPSLILRHRGGAHRCPGSCECSEGTCPCATFPCHYCHWTRQICARTCAHSYTSVPCSASRDRFPICIEYRGQGTRLCDAVT